jgi:indolepyruvate decarboxylase
VNASAKITTLRLFERVNAFLDENTVVVTDVGDCLFAASDLFIRRGTEFLGPAYYTSLGFAVPGGIGAQLADPKLRPVVLVGDGAFQMTGVELATAVRFKLNPIVIVLNNKGYGTERPMLDGKFNDILNWKYSKLPDLFGAGKGYEVHTEKDLDEALKEAKGNKVFSIIDVHLGKLDFSPALKRLTLRMGKNV